MNATPKGSRALAGRYDKGLGVAAYAAVACLAFGLLYLLSRYSYLLFHGIAEVFSILIAWSIFIIAWNTRKTSSNGYLLFLGIAYLFVGGIDLVHTFAYKGMGVFQGYDADLPTQLWIAARYMESLSLLAAPFFLRRRVRATGVFAAYAAVTALVFLSLFLWDIFPSCFVEGSGLTAFKKISEYVICLILACAFALLYRGRDALDHDVFVMLSASILVTIASELCFTLYADPYGLLNQMGHFLKIVSFYLIYRAIVVTALTRPYDLLFREIKRSEERFRSIIENAPFGYYRVGRDGTWQYVNPVWEHMHGLSLHEVIGKSFEITQTEDDVEQARDIVRRALAGESIGGEFSRLTASGEVEYHTFNVQPVREGGEIVAIEGFADDVTSLKRAEMALLASEERYRVLADTLPQVVFETDADGRVTYVNRVATDIFGYGEDDIARGMNILDVIHPSDRARVMGAMRKMMDGSSTGATREYLALRKDGDAFPCIVYSVLITDEHGRPAGVRGILTDITERKRMEEELERINQELEVYADVVSHDLRGPISVIQSASNNLDQLVEDCADREMESMGRKIAEIIKSSADSAEALIENLLDLAKAGQVPDEVHEIDVREIVDRIIEEKSLSLREKNVRVVIDDDLGRIVADPTHIYQIFANLIGNAIAYNDNPRPEIRVSHETKGGFHAYQVRDNGSGISPREAERVFRPLYRGRNGGTGIGLSIVRRLVTLYGGEIRAYNDGGTCFAFTLGDLAAGRV